MTRRARSREMHRSRSGFGRSTASAACHGFSGRAHRRVVPGGMHDGLRSRSVRGTDVPPDYPGWQPAAIWRASAMVLRGGINGPDGRALVHQSNGPTQVKSRVRCRMDLIPRTSARRARCMRSRRPA